MWPTKFGDGSEISECGLAIEKTQKIWNFARLFVSFRFARRYSRSKEQRKVNFPLVLCSLIRIFAADY